MANFTEFQSGVNTSFSTELNTDFSFALKKSCLARIDQLRVMADAAIAERGDKLDTERDIFSDADGYNDTINTSNTTANFNSGEFYERQVSEGSADVWSSSGTSTNVTSLTINATASSLGYISLVSAETTAAISSTWDIIIKNSGGTTIASKQIVTGASTDINATFLKSDYSEFIAVGTFSIQITRVSGSASLRQWNSQSYSGTDWSFTSQNVLGETSSARRIEFTPLSFLEGVLETDPLTSSGNNIDSIFIIGQKEDDGTNLITYDVSSDNGSTYTTGLSLGKIYDITSTLGNQLIVKFNIPNDADAKLYGYSLLYGRA